MIHRLAGVIAAMTLVLLTAAPVSAGGWATIEADASNAPPPVEDEPFVVGFTVLQHGQTPAGWETPTVHFTELATGAEFEVIATGQGADGHFVATATFPDAGAWTWSVSLANLSYEPIETSVTVRATGGELPTLDPAVLLNELSRERLASANALGTRLDRAVDALESEIAAERATSARLAAQVSEIAANGTTGGLPPAAVVLISILAGATAGFAMVWLAGRSAPRALTLSAAVDPGSSSLPRAGAPPSPRGSTPA